MKTMIALMAMVLLVLALPTATLAQEVTTTSQNNVVLEEIPVMPDSAFYGFSRFAERIQYAFTLREENKARLELRFAERRLVESEAMAEKGDGERAIKLMDEYSKGVNNTQALIARAQERGRDTEEIDTHVAERLTKHVQVLEKVRTQVPEAAQFGIDTAIGSSQQNIEDIRERIQERVQERVDVIDQARRMNEDELQPTDNFTQPIDNFTQPNMGSGQPDFGGNR